ncbi:hypothetical protein [Streptomyces mirabilis]|uniref:Uncharacterized protein n=1 Tax=Streptomyces mirabilis TaxID=68239 RepID=A0A1I2XTW8_9ACTN|nr:hypothetical protein [Streptomyces mirabilis]SFH16832.1 hypothetical protein SAMN02787118_15213 [Streptomyces mirabilis]
MDADLLRTLGGDPAALDTAPSWTPYRGTAMERPDGGHRCTRCGQPARAPRLVDVPGLGPCRLDTCRDDFLAVTRLLPSRMPSMVEGIVADLREVARDAGAPLTIFTDDGMPG